TDGERRGAFAIEAEVAACGSMQRNELQAAVGEGLGDGANILPGGVVEVAARGEDFDGLKARGGDLREDFRGEFFGDEEVGGEDSEHGSQFSARNAVAHTFRDEVLSP